MDKVYIVMCTDSPSYGDSHYIHAVFSDKAKAEKCAEINSLIEEDDGYSYYVKEEKISDYDLNAVVKEYYTYYIGKELPPESLDDLRYNYWELKEYLLEKGYISSEIEEIEQNDNSLNEIGNRAYNECFSYFRNKLTSEQLKEVIEEFSKPEYQWNNDEEVEKRVYTKDLVIDETDTHIQVFSVNSYEEAKNTALNLYERWKSTQ